MLTLSITPEVEEIVQIEAAKRGLKAEEYALQVFLDGLTQSKLSNDAEFEAALDEAFGFLADKPSIGPSWREQKEEEMTIEEAKHQRLFGQGRL